MPNKEQQRPVPETLLGRKSITMKNMNLKIGLLFLFTNFITGCFAQPVIDSLTQTSSDSLVQELLSIDEDFFVGKPLNSILLELPPNYIKMKIAGGHRMNHASLLRVKYPNSVWIDLHVREFTHMNPKDDNWVWDISLMRKEKLDHIVIFKDTKCYKHCDEIY